MKKKEFYICYIDFNNDKYCKGVRKVKGCVDEEAGIGYNKNTDTKDWTATDLESGMKLISQKTMKACVEWMENNPDKMVQRLEIKKTEAYKKHVLEFNDLIRGDEDEETK